MGKSTENIGLFAFHPPPPNYLGVPPNLSLVLAIN